MKKRLLFMPAFAILLALVLVSAQSIIPAQENANPNPITDSLSPTTVMNLILLFAVIAIFELVMKGFALWRAAKRNSLAWFIIILVVNTAGILPLIYLIVTQYRPVKRHRRQGSRPQAAARQTRAKPQAKSRSTRVSKKKK